MALAARGRRDCPTNVCGVTREAVRTLPLVRVVGSGKERFNVLHAEFFGTDAELDAGEFSAEDVASNCCGDASSRWATATRSGNAAFRSTYCGHTPMRDIQQIGSQVFIDTGAFGPGGKLTIVEARRHCDAGRCRSKWRVRKARRRLRCLERRAELI